MQPELSGALFVLRNDKQKSGTERGNSCSNNMIKEFHFRTFAPQLSSINIIYP